MSDEQKIATLQSLNNAEASLARLKKYNESNGEFTELYSEYMALKDEGVLDLRTRIRLMERFIGLFCTLDAMRKRV